MYEREGSKLLEDQRKFMFLNATRSIYASKHVPTPKSHSLSNYHRVTIELRKLIILRLNLNRHAIMLLIA